MKKFILIAIQILLGLLALVQMVRIIGRYSSTSDKAIGAILLFLFVAAMIKIHRWHKRNEDGQVRTSNGGGIYIVTLNNNVPISVNAHDPRVANRAIEVTRANCKFGKANNLNARKMDYEKTFGIENVNFFPIAAVDDINAVERHVLMRLDEYRVLGATNRKNEWLVGITPIDLEIIVFSALDEGQFEYRRIGSVHNPT